jgi:hypothetical protein
MPEAAVIPQPLFSHWRVALTSGVSTFSQSLAESSRLPASFLVRFPARHANLYVHHVHPRFDTCCNWLNKSFQIGLVCLVIPSSTW